MLLSLALGRPPHVEADAPHAHDQREEACDGAPCNEGRSRPGLREHPPPEFDGHEGLGDRDCNPQPCERPQLQVLLALTPSFEELVVLAGGREGQEEEKHQPEGVEGVARGDPQHVLQEEGIDLEQEEGCDGKNALQTPACIAAFSVETDMDMVHLPYSVPYTSGRRH